MAVLLLVFLGCSFAAAQLRDRTQRNKPPDQTTQPTPKPEQNNRARALAVVEFLPKGGVRLVPIALWVDNKFYDASLYGANPAPLSLEPQTVYQATDYGEPTGLFTVTTPEQVNGNWVAEGYWKAQSAFDLKMAESKAKEAANQPKHSGGPMDGDFDDSRPVLKRAPGSGSSSSSSGSSTTAASSNPSGASSSGSSTTGSKGSSSGGSDAGSSSSSSGSSTSNASGRPTLSRPGEVSDISLPPDSTTTASNSSQGASSSTGRDDDPDRPTLKAAPHSSDTGSSSAGSSSSQTAASNSSPKSQSSGSSESADESDPDRPVLQRGKPAKQTTANDLNGPSKPSNASGSTGANALKGASSQPARAYPAISDPGKYEMRSLLYAISPEDRKDKGSQMAAMALADIRAFTAKRNSPPLPKTSVINDYELRAFDLDFSNSPTLVLTAKVPVPGKTTIHGAEFDYYVTVVARLLTDGTPQKIFSSVTDYNHLDAFPRMELIDAVDADANGRGDLLFRQYSDTGVNYGLYRVFPYQMQKVFEGGSSM